eukprot:TRINITY_DN3989_c1_g4_i1.p1 TRINITY_DN3989_c1_g4~~TRINITY_DN3989_c1_g4_i1.p1  ORF type:complete len:423 (+),score=70.99 TRINITY_DN3989_c1_g4_i1:102-1271(+)
MPDSSSSSSSSTTSSGSSSSSSSGGLFKFNIEEGAAENEELVVPEKRMAPKISMKKAIRAAPVKRALGDGAVAATPPPPAKKMAIEDILLTIPVPKPSATEPDTPMSSSSSSSSSAAAVEQPQPPQQQQPITIASTTAPPPGVYYYSWLRVPHRPTLGFSNAYDATGDPRLRFVPKTNSYTPHKMILMAFASTLNIAYVPVVTLAAATRCLAAAISIMRKRRNISRIGAASAVFVAVISAVNPPVVSYAPQQVKPAPVEVVETPSPPPPPPRLPLDLEKYKINIRMEYWLGLKRIPPWVTKAHLTTFFSTPSRPVLAIRFFYNIKESQGPTEPLQRLSYATIQFPSSEHVAACLNQVWIIDGNVVLEPVDCCGAMYGRFVCEVNKESGL